MIIEVNANVQGVPQVVSNMGEETSFYNACELSGHRPSFLSMSSFLIGSKAQFGIYSALKELDGCCGGSGESGRVETLLYHD